MKKQQLTTLLAEAIIPVTLLFLSVGYAQELILADLVLDLNADTGLVIEDGNRVTSWANQAPHPKPIDFRVTEEGRTKTIVSQTELGTGRPTLLKNVREINGHASLSFRKD